jgi:hypothetical protein
MLLHDSQVLMHESGVLLHASAIICTIGSTTRCICTIPGCICTTRRYLCTSQGCFCTLRRLYARSGPPLGAFARFPDAFARFPGAYARIGDYMHDRAHLSMLSMAVTGISPVTAPEACNASSAPEVVRFDIALAMTPGCRRLQPQNEAAPSFCCDQYKGLCPCSTEHPR